MTPEDMKRRLKAFALRCCRLAASFPRSPLGKVATYQLIRCATSSAANYNAACIAQSRADFTAKLAIVEQELDEAVFWVDFSSDAELTSPPLTGPLLQEGRELLKITIASRKTAKVRRTRGTGGSKERASASIGNGQLAIGNGDVP